jgi:acyl-coenzyme A synthetase/AMP-(fatty) acid ligase
MNYRALFAMIKIADQIGQTDPHELSAMLSLFPKTLHLPQASLEVLSKLQARVRANNRQRPIGNGAGNIVVRRPGPMDKHLEKQRTRARMNEDIAHEEFVG